MTTSIIITLCVLLLAAYLFDISAPKIRIPSVILLLALGWSMHRLTDAFAIDIPNMEPALPVLGTIGLILIVLEGSLDLELNKSKIRLVTSSAIIALVPLLIFSFGLGYAFYYFGDMSYKIALANAIPISVISSAIAITTAANLEPTEREFITYESSLSDIFGVILFNFITLNTIINHVAIGLFVVNILIMFLIAFFASICLAFMLSRIKHHVKFAPIIIMILLIYSVSKIYHLPGLIFIMIFGLFVGNLDELKDIPYIDKLHPEILNREARKFKELTKEFVFLIRSLFFILFGYMIETSEIMYQGTMMWSLAIVASIFLIRFLFLKIFKLPIFPLLFIAPRGLITILLFISIPVDQFIPYVNRSLIIQIIVLTSFILMFGMMFYKKKEIQTTFG
jgi:potassium/hydrogen antiporter